MGDAATPALPDFTSQTASVYKANIDAGFAVADRIAWAFAAHEQDVGSPQPDMTVRLESGAIWDGTTLAEVAEQDTAVITAPSVNPRIDRVVIDATTGAISVITGAEAASPTPPAITSGKIPIAQVALTTSTTVITDSDITDERMSPSGISSGSFPSGTKMLFQQAAAPTGWTTDTSHDNKTLRISSGGSPFGSGGATGFTGVFGSGKTAGAHTLTAGEMPSHPHDVQGRADLAGSATAPRVTTQGSGATNTASAAATATGGGGSHNHTLSLDLQYVDAIIASKD